MDQKVNKTLENLRKNGFNVKYFEIIEEANEEALKAISLDDSVGIGGSVTIQQMGLYDGLKKRGNEVYWHHKCQPEEKQEILMNADKADVYLSGTNAITMDGKLINIDGRGNRVANMTWGHDKIIIISGVNKITRNYEEGIHRIKTVACPQNAERLDLNVPCRYTGECTDCSSPQRMCRIVSVLERQPMNGNIHIYIINKELGY